MKNVLQRLASAVRTVDLAAVPRRGLALLCLSLLAACSTPVPPPPQVTVAEPPPAAALPPAPPPVAAPAVPLESQQQAFERMLSGIAAESVFFDFDKFAIKGDQVTVISDNAKLATGYPNDYLTLQGNCDERGSREYNLALGQRRADAVKGRLVLLGVPERQIETVSFGKEKPRAQCHDETCWSENRRADLVHELK